MLEKGGDTAAFEAVFGVAPTHLSRAPGRVNLIGEHIDYNDLPVLPIALQREARMLLRARPDGRMRIHNVDPAFDPVEFDLAREITPGVPGSWENYVKAAAWGVQRHFPVERGIDALFFSDIPVAAGLSSSSALVNAVGLALCGIAGIEVEVLELARIMAEAEQFTGTRGGGMDQAVSLAARPGHAALIAFAPLKVRHIPIPRDWDFIVADTGVAARKSGSAQAAYNRRREECEEALSRVVAVLAEEGDLHSGRIGYRELLSGLGPEEALRVGEEALEGNLLRRFRHVVTEARRVERACDALRVADRREFGALMDQSHASLRSDFHVSSAELDELVLLAAEGGAAGARLTGAGFGGCIVALASPTTMGSVLETLVSGYYEPRGLTDGLDRHLFMAVPSGGASFSEVA